MSSVNKVLYIKLLKAGLIAWPIIQTTIHVLLALLCKISLLAFFNKQKEKILYSIQSVSCKSYTIQYFRKQDEKAFYFFEIHNFDLRKHFVFTNLKKKLCIADK
eukprot:GHVU01160773.1.p1 GENE.GHVU01160773.1~~GHVU01160773.1.p1  ORF type:complete len:104 (+),score=4.28 GHVU01160773.1:330-641(+)